MQRGFTLIELLVVLAIIGILSTVSFLGVKDIRENIALDQAAHKIAQDITRTARMSLMGEPYGGCPFGMKIQGYGVHFDRAVRNCYFIYAECDNVTTFDVAPDTVAPCTSPALGDDKIVETIPFKKGVWISSVRTFNVAVDPIFAQIESASILFTPPKPVVSIEGSAYPAVWARIVIRGEGNTNFQERTIEVNQKGRVEIIQ